MMWQVGPSSEPADVSDRLTRHGFVPEGETPGMAVDLFTLVREAPPAGVSIRRILELEDLRTAVAIMCDVFGFPNSFLDTLLRMVSAGGTSHDAPMAHYGAWVDGEMVAASAVVYAAGVAGIYNVATRESYRRRGIGRAITLAPLLDARTRGCRIGILQSSDMGYSTYQKLGFERYALYRAFVWDGDNSAKAAGGP
jgi:GNAT superfamily N-acetyltransferase